MRLLVADVGDLPGDWAWGVAGELVRALDPCDASTYGGLGEHCVCGCVEGFVGLASGLATTAARVAEVDLTPVDLEEIAGPDGAANLLAAAAPFPVGTRVRRRLDVIEAP